MSTIYFPPGDYLISCALRAKVTDNGDGTATITMLSGDDDWVNVKDYGAVGDGETDDTAAIQAAIDAAAR